MIRALGSVTSHRHEPIPKAVRYIASSLRGIPGQVASHPSMLSAMVQAAARRVHGRTVVLLIGGLLDSSGCQLGATELSKPVASAWLPSPQKRLEAQLLIKLGPARHSGSDISLSSFTDWKEPCIHLVVRDPQNPGVSHGEEVMCLGLSSPVYLRWNLTRHARKLLAPATLTWSPSEKYLQVNAGDLHKEYAVEAACGGFTVAPLTPNRDWNGAFSQIDSQLQPVEQAKLIYEQRTEELLRQIPGVTDAVASAGYNDFPPEKPGWFAAVHGALVVVDPKSSLSPNTIAAQFNRLPDNRDIPLRMLSARCVHIVPSLATNAHAREARDSFRYQLARATADTSPVKRAGNLRPALE